MRTILVVAAILVTAGSVRAQPGQLPSQYGYQPQPQLQLQLSEEDRELLEQGEITDSAQLAGGIASLFIGFGVGQAVEGRWGDTGWIFTLGESASVAALVWGVVDAFEYCDLDGSSSSRSCNSSTALVAGGVIGLGVFRVWEVIDAFVAPPAHNERVRALRARLGYPQAPRYGLAPYVAPLRAGDGGAVAGVTLRF